MMHMTFYWSKNVTLLTDSWRTNSWLSYALTLLACLLLAVSYQFLEDRRLRFKLLASSSEAIESPLYRKVGSGDGRAAARIAGSALFGASSAIGYLMMLAVMSFNGGVFVAVVSGLAIGYFVYRSGGGGGGDDVTEVENPCACA